MKKGPKPRNPDSNGFEPFYIAEMQGFEPWRRFRPSAFRVRPLRPLGYISKNRTLKI